MTCKRLSNCLALLSSSISASLLLEISIHFIFFVFLLVISSFFLYQIDAFVLADPSIVVNNQNINQMVQAAFRKDEYIYALLIIIFVSAFKFRIKFRLFENFLFLTILYGSLIVVCFAFGVEMGFTRVFTEQYPWLYVTWFDFGFRDYNFSDRQFLWSLRDDHL